MRLIASISKTSSLCLLVLLPFLIPYEAGRNIDMQGLILLIAGGLAWLALLLEKQVHFKKLPTIFIGVFLLACILSTLANPHVGYDLLGGPLVRLGTLAFIALPGCALLITQTRLATLIRYLYVEILVIGTVSFLYNLYEFHTLTRIGGVFAQADVLACVIGCGIILGLQVLLHTRHARLVIVGQLFLAILLALTGTRAVMAIVFLLIVMWALQARNWRLSLLGLIVVLLTIGGFHQFAAARSTDVHDATGSISYRTDLWSAGITAATHKPLLGYGSGNLADALDCRTLHAPALHDTCRKHYFFNSSHNIFLDRVMAVGWVGGLAFLSFVLFALHQGFRQPERRIMALTALLISLYYLTNVTAISLELFYWVLLFACLRPTPQATHIDM